MFWFFPIKLGGRFTRIVISLVSSGVLLHSSFAGENVSFADIDNFGERQVFFLSG